MEQRPVRNALADAVREIAEGHHEDAADPRPGLGAPETRNLR
jgi:hypothetical protein